MAEDTTLPAEPTSSTPIRRPRRRAASRPAGPPEAGVAPSATSATASEPPAWPASGATEPAPPLDPTPVSAGPTADTVSANAISPATDSERESGLNRLDPEPPARVTPKRATTRRSTAKRQGTKAGAVGASETGEPAADRQAGPPDEPAGERSAARKRATRKKPASIQVETPPKEGGPSTPIAEKPAVAQEASRRPSPSLSTGESVNAAAESASDTAAGGAPPPVALLFQAPDPEVVPVRPRRTSRDSLAVDSAPSQVAGDLGPDPSSPPSSDAASDVSQAGDGGESSSSRRRRSRGGRNRRKSGDADRSGADPSLGDAAASGDRPVATADAGAAASSGGKQATDDSASPQLDVAPASSDLSGTDDEVGSSHRRRRRRRGGEDSVDAASEAEGTVARTRAPRAKKDTITSVEGSTRIEAKRQRRREGRDAGRRRPPILSESEFLARRESVERVMAIRQRGETTQIGVLEDNVLVEHYVAIASQSSMIGNVYLGRVQNVLPSMEAAFIDIGKGRNAVLYAGEVDWETQGNQPRRIENVLKSGQTVLVQVSKDPVGHKGARLTSQISLPGRYLVYVPSGGQSGISRKLADTERSRLKSLLKDIIPDEAGVIIRTAAEGASEEELTRDVTRLKARWEDIEKKIKSGQAPALLYAEPDTTLKVVRDLFTEDFTKLVISGDDAWDMVEGYVQHVAPDLGERLERYEGEGDVFADYRIDEQIAKAMERKVWLPSGGSLVIDRTEAMTVVDVNTGKFTGSGGNLEETVTKNNLEAAEEVVRQLRLRDIGGIIVIDFIDMVLEDNRDLVLRRLVECLSRDRTRHQVAEVTSLGLVQMTRKRISTGLIESFSHPCEACQGRGVVIHHDPVEIGGSDRSKRSSGSPAGSDSGTGSRSGSEVDSAADSKPANGSRGSAKRPSTRRRGGKAGPSSDTSDSDNAPIGADKGEGGVAERSDVNDLESTPVLT